MKLQAARLATEQGIRLALARGERVRFFTLTEDPGRPLDLPALGSAWNRLRTSLKDAGKLAEYVAVAEVTKAGRLHLHVVCTGEYIRKDVLRELAVKAGFGKVVDISALGGEKTPKRLVKREEMIGRVADYVAKYLTAESKRREALEAHARERLRPVRFSRGWGASLGSARRDLITQWQRERGKSASESHPADDWLMVIPAPSTNGYRVFRRGAEIDAGDVDLLVNGITPMQDLVPVSVPSLKAVPVANRPAAPATRLPRALFEARLRDWEDARAVRRPRARASPSG